MSELADNLAQWLVEHVHLPRVPPIDVEDLAHRMGIDAIVNAQMIEDGRLDQDGETATIYLRSGIPDSRRRFTIAHELGHRLLLHPRAPAERYRRRLVSDAEERLCDAIAAAILLPRRWVAANYNTALHDLATIRHLAARTGTSLGASLVRLCEVADWPESLLRFRFVNDKWRLDAPAAVPLSIHGQIRTTTRTSETLASVGRRTRADIRSALPIMVGQTEHIVPAELSVTRTVAVALVDFHDCTSERDGPRH